MRELPILFSTPMVQAKLAGRKTQTRRTVNHDGLYSLCDLLERTAEKSNLAESLMRSFTDEGSPYRCPYGAPGDLLWTREAWRSLAFDDNTNMMAISFRANPNGQNKMNWIKMPDGYRLFAQTSWKPSIHMHKAAARIWDEVTGIRIERLADISEDDAIKEGIEVLHPNNPNGAGPLYKNYLGNVIGFNSARESFKSLFLSINGKVTAVKDKAGAITHYEAIAWDEADYKERFEYSGGFWRNKPLKVTVNPWVWVISYKNLSTTGHPSTVTEAAAL